MHSWQCHAAYRFNQMILMIILFINLLGNFELHFIVLSEKKFWCITHQTLWRTQTIKFGDGQIHFVHSIDPLLEQSFADAIHHDTWMLRRSSSKMTTTCNFTQLHVILGYQRSVPQNHYIIHKIIFSRSFCVSALRSKQRSWRNKNNLVTKLTKFIFI